MSTKTKSPALFAGRTPEAQLKEVQANIAAAEAEIEQHKSRRPAEVVGRMSGDPDAAQRLVAIDNRVIELDHLIFDLRQAEQELRRRISQRDANARKAETEGRTRRIAELSATRKLLIQQAEDAVARAAEAIQAIGPNGVELAALLGHDHGRRWFSVGAFQARAQSGFARKMAIDPHGSLTPQNSYLGIQSSWVGESSWMTTVEAECRGLDDIAPFFLTEEDAHEARLRLASRDIGGPSAFTPAIGDQPGSRKADPKVEAAARKIVIVPLPTGIFTLVRPEHVFGDRQSADAAARGSDFSVRPHAGGFVLVPARFTGEV